jgi:anti-sigma B factor antagonist
MPQAANALDVRQGGEETAIIDVRGEITAASETQLMDAYAAASGDRTRAIILNFTGLEYMNSTGIGLLVTLLVRANRQRQQVRAYGLNEHYRQIFELTRLDEAITVHDGEADALATAVGSRPGRRSGDR